MVWLKTLCAAISTYSVLPMPQFPWEERTTRYAICCLPVAGLICGGLLLLWHWLCVRFSLSGVLFAAAATALPLLVTGGIHMDGFMDTVDALASHRDREKKLEILKDSHCGAFAVIYCGVYLLCSFGVYFELYRLALPPVYGAVFVVSRLLSALLAVTLPNARKGGMLYALTKNVYKRRAVTALAVLLVLAAAGLLWLSPLEGGIALFFGVLVVLFYCPMTKKQFGGVTGDTAGFFLQVCELAMPAGFLLGGLL